MGKSVRLAIDDEFDMPLRPALDILAAMRAGLAKAELAEQRGQIRGLGFADGEFDEADAAALRFRLQRGRRRHAGRACRQLIFQQDQRTQSVGGGADRGAGTKLIVENFQRQRAGVAGGLHRGHEFRHRQIALPGETAEMPAPRQYVETKLWRVRELDQKDLVRRDRMIAATGSPGASA